MDVWERIYYTAAMVLSTVPLATLRYWPFRRDTRLPVWAFWSIYTVILLLELVWMSAANWPEPLAFELRQRSYLGFMLLFSLLFFIGIRRFWQQLFVFGVLCVYGAPVLILPPLLGNQLLPGLPDYSGNCLVLLLEFVLTWRWMRRFLTETLAPFYIWGTKSFWRMAWLLPFGFFTVEIIFSVEHSTGNVMKPVSLIICYIGALGMFTSLHFMQGILSRLQENRILEQNIGEAQRLYQLQLASCQRLAQEARESRRMRHDLRHIALELENQLNNKDWPAFSQALEAYTKRLQETKERFKQGEDA